MSNLTNEIRMNFKKLSEYFRMNIFAVIERKVEAKS